MKTSRSRTWIVYAGLLFLLVFLLSSQLFRNADGQKPDELSTSEFTAAVENFEVLSVEYNPSTAGLSGTYLPNGKTDPADALEFTSSFVGVDSLNALMAAHPEIGFNIDASNPDFLFNILGYLLPLLLFGVIIFIFFTQFNQANNKQMQFGKAKAKKSMEERPKTKFADVAGIDEAVEELEEIKEFLSNPQRFQELGAKIPRGVLLVGPPGTGKTLLARAVAGEAGVPFFSISGSDFVEMFVGVGASRVRDLFERAKQAAPSIIFIDEIDAVGRQRGAGLGGGHDEREQTLNQLLVEMDGFEENSSVILIAATNRVDILDPALLRPGRFDRQIVVDRPDLKGREKILKVHSEGKPLAHSVDLERLARLTPGFTGADLANLMNEAALLTARRGKKLITMTELSEAMEREIAGPERKGRIITEKEKTTIAYHESGHALVGHILENSDPVHKISIISRGQALGYTLSLPTEDRFLNTREEMYDDLAVFLGGRVAEEIFCKDITTGASNDLERATKMARQMVTRYGMTEALGSQVYGEANHEVFLGRDYGATPDYSDETARRIDEEVALIMKKAHDRAYKVLISRKKQMELMVAVLLDRETVEGDALEALLTNTWDNYIAHEDEILAKRAADLKKQEEDDERRRIAEQREAARQAAIHAQIGMEPGKLPVAPVAPIPPGGGFGGPGVGGHNVGGPVPPTNGIGDPVPPASGISNKDTEQGRFVLDDVFSGRIKLEDLMTGEQPHPQPDEKPEEKPEEKPAAEPAAKTTAKTAKKPAAKAATKPAAKQAAKTTAKPAAKPAAKLATKPVTKPAAKPATKPKAAAQPKASAARKSAPKKPAAPTTSKRTPKKPANKGDE
ncbi:MAG: ATP-dependent zinc metalloprotease FtsH [Coriobacteriia bacterium]|nr:ATP-dependent zinc metalloprotease FtsH [Coriobacteriia bacterium]